MLLSCDDAEIIINCDCGEVTGTGITGIKYFVSVTNECTGVNKNLVFEQQFVDAVFIGQRICDPKINF